VEKLRRLGAGELVVGQVLPGHLCDRTGRVLIPKGRRLTPEDLERLGTQQSGELYAGPDWPASEGSSSQDDVAPMDVDEWMNWASKRRHGPTGGRGRTRRHPRRPWNAKLELVIEECCDGFANLLKIAVNTSDISPGGFAFTCGRFVHPGTTVYVRFRTLPGQPVIKGIVRDCIHLAGREHRVGVEFIQLQPKEAVRGI